MDPARRTHLKHLALYGASVLLPPTFWRESAPPPPTDAEDKPERIEEHWFTGGKPLFSRTPLNKLIRETQREPFSGVGKPEPLKHALSGFWSRRITDEHRMVYKVEGDALLLAQLRYHY